jgi:hypothetical protein
VRSATAALDAARAELDAARAAQRDERALREASDASRAYLKNVLLRAMEKGGVNSLLDEALFPVIATSLCFTAEETRGIAEARASARRGWLG